MKKIIVITLISAATSILASSCTKENVKPLATDIERGSVGDRRDVGSAD